MIIDGGRRTPTIHVIKPSSYPKQQCIGAEGRWGLMSAAAAVAIHSSKLTPSAHRRGDVGPLGHIQCHIQTYKSSGLITTAMHKYTMLLHQQIDCNGFQSVSGIRLRASGTTYALFCNVYLLAKLIILLLWRVF